MRTTANSSCQIYSHYFHRKPLLCDIGPPTSPLAPRPPPAHLGPEPDSWSVSFSCHFCPETRATWPCRASPKQQSGPTSPFRIGNTCR